MQWGIKWSVLNVLTDIHNKQKQLQENMMLTIATRPAISARSSQRMKTNIACLMIFILWWRSSSSFYILPIICLPSTLFTDVVHKVLIVYLDSNQTRGICARWLVTLRSCTETSPLKADSYLYSYSHTWLFIFILTQETKTRMQGKPSSMHPIIVHN